MKKKRRDLKQINDTCIFLSSFSFFSPNFAALFARETADTKMYSYRFNTYKACLYILQPINIMYVRMCLYVLYIYIFIYIWILGGDAKLGENAITEDEVEGKLFLIHLARQYINDKNEINEEQINTIVTLNYKSILKSLIIEEKDVRLLHALKNVMQSVRKAEKKVYPIILYI